LGERRPFAEISNRGGIVIIELRPYFTLRRRLPEGADEERFELPDGATVGELKQLLGAGGDPSITTLVNGHPRPDRHVIRHGDVVTVFPPVEGG
jgi:molybdopterin converting factor small subunit